MNSKDSLVQKNNDLDFLTVVLLTHNRKEYVQKSLNAILKQSYSNFKIIIIDNHSSDGTIEVITTQIKDDERVTYIRLNKNSNAGNSFHIGVMTSRSEFVLVTHDDDILDNDYIENIFKICSVNSDIGLIASNAKLIDENDNVVNSNLYDLKKNIEISRNNYLEYYLSKKLWLPTPSLCFRKIHYLNYVGHDVYPLFTRKNALTKNSDLVKYKPSGDILFNLYINQFQKIYMFHHTYLSYRQHSGQESRNVNQSEPMVWLFENIYKNKIKIKSQNKYLNIKAKYIIQEYLINNDFGGLKKYLYYEKNCIHVLLAKELFLNEKNTIQQREAFTDDHYSEFLANIQNNVSVINEELISNKKQVVLVGSMLCSFYVDSFLRSKEISPFAVIDFAPSRQGKFININQIQSYKQFFDVNKNEFLYIITSERENDTSIINKINEYGGKGKCIYWQDLFALKGI
jgi:glycosyltransferase involved in cell wall biosynthesis